MKTCAGCKATKPLDEFWRDSRASDGLVARCKSCMRAYRATSIRTAEWWDKKKADADWIARRRAAGRAYTSRTPGRRHGITVAQYMALSEAQGHVCAACGQPETKVSRHGTLMRLAVDHDHSCCPGPRSCGKCVRGLLCGGCNESAGRLGEDPDRLLALAAYLLQTRNVLGVPA